VTRVLFLFLDGVGLGKADPDHNPLAAARMPALVDLLGGRRLVAGAAPYHGPRASLLEVDARLGVPGTPQSATGQAALLTGRNVPDLIGEHYGPKPNPAIAAQLENGNIFHAVLRMGRSAALLNAYPPRYFDAIRSRRRLYSAIPLAATAAGVPLMTEHDLRAGRALAADFTGQGWAAQPDFPPAPVYPARAAGALAADLARQYDLTWFDYWPSDIAGHHRDMPAAVRLLETFDAVLAGLVEAWADRPDLIAISSDHGNLEDLSERGHTLNPVPALLIGPNSLRQSFADGLRDLTHIAPAILRVLNGGK
jgi:hypothetical protein